MYRYCSTKLDTNAVKLPSVRRESTNHFPEGNTANVVLKREVRPTVYGYG